MAEVALFHHAHGLTPGVLAFAGALRSAGHVVHAPDLYDGRTFGVRADGLRFAEQIGFEALIDRARPPVQDMPDALVYAGFSLGVLPAQLLAQTRPGARGAVLLHGCVDPADLGAPWPHGVPLQIHMMDADEWVLPPNGDLAAARALVESVDGAELFLYAGDRHLFTDSSLPDHDQEATSVVLERVPAFLQRIR